VVQSVSDMNGITNVNRQFICCIDIIVTYCYVTDDVIVLVSMASALAGGACKSKREEMPINEAAFEADHYDRHLTSVTAVCFFPGFHTAHCLFSHPHKTYKYTVCADCRIFKY
jgi:hypothetical protein